MSEVILDAAIFKEVVLNFTYFPSPVSPYTLLVESNPYKPLMTNGHTLP